MVEINGAPPVDEIKVRSVAALCDELRGLSPDDQQYAVVLRRLDKHWRTLSPTEQDEIDRIASTRRLPAQR